MALITKSILRLADLVSILTYICVYNIIIEDIILFLSCDNETSF